MNSVSTFFIGTILGTLAGGYFGGILDRVEDIKVKTERQAEVVRIIEKKGSCKNEISRINNMMDYITEIEGKNKKMEEEVTDCYNKINQIMKQETEAEDQCINDDLGEGDLDTEEREALVIG